VFFVGADMCKHAAANVEKARTMSSYWEPETRVLRDFDFVIWASDGLWDLVRSAEERSFFSNKEFSKVYNRPCVRDCGQSVRSFQSSKSATGQMS
jgi:serine/threonine protein phosphatase PrpC